MSVSNVSQEDPSKPSQRDINLFVLAGGTGNHAEIQIFIENCGKEWVDAIAASGLTAATAAAYCGRIETITLLLKAGADINAVDSYGQTVLHSAVSGSTGEAIISFLLMQGVDVEVKDKGGRTALMLAKHLSHQKEAEQLTKWSLLQLHLKQERQKNRKEAVTASERIDTLKKKKLRKPVFAKKI